MFIGIHMVALSLELLLSCPSLLGGCGDLVCRVGVGCLSSDVCGARWSGSISGSGGSDPVAGPSSDSLSGSGGSDPVMEPCSDSVSGSGGSDSVVGLGFGCVSGSNGSNFVMGPALQILPVRLLSDSCQLQALDFQNYCHWHVTDRLFETRKIFWLCKGNICCHWHANDRDSNVRKICWCFYGRKTCQYRS